MCSQVKNVLSLKFYFNHYVSTEVKFLYIPTKFLLKIALLKNYTTMALFYILSIRGQRNNNMRCSIHSMPRQTLWVSHFIKFPPLFCTLYQKVHFAHIQKIQDHVHWTIESFMNFVYKKNKTQSLISNDSIQFTPHVF